ncbi:MAG: hypothetical protein HOH04_17640 [Rhodospirillaceae bacterium]|jgi:hypothetical protein|nr:hypothetical protein [Rhodospirillaceae bacterium]
MGHNFDPGKPCSLMMTSSDHPFHIRYKCAGSLDSLNDWLKSNCNGGYEYKVDPGGTCAGDFTADDVVIHFQHSDDLKRFRKMAGD